MKGGKSSEEVVASAYQEQPLVMNEERKEGGWFGS